MANKTKLKSKDGKPENRSVVRSRNEQTGSGGELHQVAAGAHSPLTTNQGVPLSDNQNSLRTNARGPTLLEDFILREKIFHFDHERIPERIVHARATGVHGYFQLTASLRGHYAYDREKYAWTDGRFIENREGRTYTPYALERRGDNWYFRPGY
jgi:hypothetical protein